MSTSDLILTASSTADEAIFFYVVSGVLVVIALALSFYGMRSENFPSSGQAKGILAGLAVVVAATGVGAVLTARDEQKERRIHNQEAALEANEETEEKEAELGSETEGEAAEPEGEEGGAGGGGAAAEGDVELGGTVFTDQGCGSCHTLAAAGASGQIGPDLDEVIPGQSAAMVTESIVDPEAEIAEGFSAGAMPTTYGDDLSTEELDALVAYLLASAGS